MINVPFLNTQINKLTKWFPQFIVHLMVNYMDVKLSSVFSALSDPTRRAMLQRLSQGEMSVADLSRPFAITKSAITKHVKILENTGLLERRIEGRTHFCKLNPLPIRQASEWIRFYEQYWNDKFDALDAYLSQEDEP